MQTTAVWQKNTCIILFFPTGVLDTISQKYESLDYEVNFNSLMLDEIRKRGWKFVLAKVSASKES